MDFTNVRLAVFWTIVVSVVVVSGCGISKTATAEPTTPVVPTPTSSTTPVVHGQFPDLDKFTEVDWHPYGLGGRPTPGYMIRFTIPGGSTRCEIGNGLGMSCVGNLVGLPEVIPDRAWPSPPNTGLCSVVETGMESDSYVFGRKGGDCPPFADTKILEPGQKLTNYQVSCVVGEGNLVACKNVVENHGFVLQSSGSWVF